MYYVFTEPVRQEGDNMISIKEIAKISGYSKSTVSAAINNKEGVGPEAREKILKICKEYKYTPNMFAQNVSNKQYKTIAVVIRDITNPFYAKLYRGVESIFEKEGYTILVVNTNNDKNKLFSIIDSLIRRRVDGIILDVSSNLMDAPDFIKQHGINCVIFGLKNSEFDSVEADDGKASYEMAKYLVEAKHCKDIMFVGPKLEENIYAQRRYNGIRKYEMEKGLFISSIYDYDKSSSVDTGIEIGRDILSKFPKLPSAIVAYNDLIAAGILKVLFDKGVDVYKDVIVTGFDHVETILFNLNTVEIPVYEMGIKAAELLWERINHNNKDVSNVILDAKVITY
jgi:DNA-binding LacI/PurR family transcriptional regulator